jgi:hypothetical protein
MRKHFESKKNSFERDDANDHRKHKKLSAYREEKNWKNHLFDDTNNESSDSDLFNYDEEEEE